MGMKGFQPRLAFTVRRGVTFLESYTSKHGNRSRSNRVESHSEGIFASIA
jgi:hypothetical protein